MVTVIFWEEDGSFDPKRRTIMIKADYHMHTYFSSVLMIRRRRQWRLEQSKRGFDGFVSQITMTGIIRRIKSQFRIDFPRYLPAIRKLKEDFRDRISIQMGVEIGFQKHLGPYYKELADTYPLIL